MKLQQLQSRMRQFFFCGEGICTNDVRWINDGLFQNCSLSVCIFVRLFFCQFICLLISLHILSYVYNLFMLILVHLYCMPFHFIVCIFIACLLSVSLSICMFVHLSVCLLCSSACFPHLHICLFDIPVYSLSVYTFLNCSHFIFNFVFEGNWEL